MGRTSACKKFGSGVAWAAYGTCDIHDKATKAKCGAQHAAPKGYFDYTDSLALLGCSKPWASAFNTRYMPQMTYYKHTLSLKLAGRVSKWMNKPGNHMVFKATGGQGTGPRGSTGTTKCQLEFGVQT